MRIDGDFDMLIRSHDIQRSEATRWRQALACCSLYGSAYLSLEKNVAILSIESEDPVTLPNLLGDEEIAIAQELCAEELELP